MARTKRIPLSLRAARAYIQEHAPEFSKADVRVSQLDGPPESPRFVATAERCGADVCPYEVPAEIAAAGACPVRNCEQWCSLRLMLNRGCEVVSEQRSATHWK